MDIDVLKKSDINIERLAELNYITMKKNNLLSEAAAEETIQSNISEKISSDCYDLVFIAENHGKIVGCVAFYEMTDLGIAQFWEWHPVVFPGEHENEIAGALLQAALSHL